MSATLALLSALGGSSVVGSLIGLAGAWFRGKQDLERMREERLQKQDQRAHEIALRDHAEKVAAAEADRAFRLAELEGEREANRLAEQRMGRALDADVEDARAGKDDWVDKWRRVMRPGLTTVLAAFALLQTVMCSLFLAWQWEALSADLKLSIAVNGVAWASGMASTAIGYWFGSRPNELPKITFAKA